MTFCDLVQQRYSVRSFKDQRVEQEKIDYILRCAQAAPTATNAQPQRILVLDDPEKLASLSECTRYHFNAPLVLLVCYNTAVSWKRSYDGMDSGQIDSAIVGTYLMLAASEIGLGSTWVMSFDPIAIRKAYGIPENFVPVALFPIGYPAADALPSPRHSQRLAIEETVFYNTFNK